MKHDPSAKSLNSSPWAHQSRPLGRGPADLPHPRWKDRFDGPRLDPDAFRSGCHASPVAPEPTEELDPPPPFQRITDDRCFLLAWSPSSTLSLESSTPSLMMSVHNEIGDARHAWEVCRIDFLPGHDWAVQFRAELLPTRPLTRWVGIHTPDRGRAAPSEAGEANARELAFALADIQFI